MGKILALLLLAAMAVQLIKPLGLPGLRSAAISGRSPWSRSRSMVATLIRL